MSSELQGSLLNSRAFWVSESIIAWNVDAGNDSCYLFASETAALSLTSDGILGNFYLSLMIMSKSKTSYKFNVTSVLTGEDVQVQLQEDRHGLPENVGSSELFIL